MLLAVDIGNTHIVLGSMDGREVKYNFRFETDRRKTEYEYALLLEGVIRTFGIDRTAYDGAIISSVVPELTGTMAKAIEFAVGLTPLIVSKGVKTGVNILIDDPASAGSDLIVAAAGALAEYEPPLILVDLGTATTITVVDAKGSFRGGAIVPGVGLALNALAAGTSQLPHIRLTQPTKCIGTNTVDSMVSGSVLGTAAMIDGMVDRMEAELGTETTVVATGGLAGTVVPNCKREITLDDDLLLRGLAVIWEKNKR